MLKKYLPFLLLLPAAHVFAWGKMQGNIEILHLNTYGNYSDKHLQGGFCFKLEGYEHYLKLKFYENGEQRSVYDFTQSLVLSAYIAQKEVKAQFVDWGTDPTCRVRGGTKPAKWLEDIMFVN